MSYLRLFGGLLGAIAIVTAGWLIKDRFHQKALADAAKACNAAAATETEPLTDCLQSVLAEVTLARQSRTCEQALLPELRPETRFLMSQACGAGVKRLAAQMDAATSERDGALAQLATARSDMARAVGRAERRASQQQERDDHARKVIADAPRDAGGGIHCDADCLRRLGR